MYPTISSNAPGSVDIQHDGVAVQTEREARPSLPGAPSKEQLAAHAAARRHQPGSHPLAAQYRMDSDRVTGSTVPQSLQEIHQNTVTRAGDNTSHAATQTMHNDSIRHQTLENVKALFKGIDNQTSVGLEQDRAMVREIAEASEMPSPKGTHATDCVTLPPDEMAYRVHKNADEYELQYNCPEINGTGFGGIRDFHPETLQTVMRTYFRGGQEIAAQAAAKGETPLIIVANSGREGARRTDGQYPPSSNSKMIWEKAYVADVLAEGISTKKQDVFGESLDDHVTAYYKELDAVNSNPSLNPQQRKQAQEKAYQNATARMAEHKDKPLVLLGYSVDLAACCRIHEGRPTLFGRPVHGAVNDRGLQNLSLTEHKDLDFLKFSPMNATIKEGVDKYEAALAWAEFRQSGAYEKLAGIAEERGFHFDPLGLGEVRHFKRGEPEPVDMTDKSEFEKAKIRSTYFRGITAQEGLEGVSAAWDEFAKVDLKPLFKPNGTGQSKGIIAAKAGESKADFLKRFEKNLEEIGNLFGKGAGYPFQAMPLLKLDETDKNEAYDLRFAIYQNTDEKNNFKLQTVPLILKKEPPKEKPGSATELEFSPTNVTAAVAATGKKGTDFIVSLCSKEGLEQAHLTMDQAKSKALVFSGFMQWLLDTRYKRPEAQLTEHNASSAETLDDASSSGGEQSRGTLGDLGAHLQNVHLIEIPERLRQPDEIGRSFPDARI